MSVGRKRAADLGLLAQIGMSAALRGRSDQARAIFDALAVCRPEHAAAQVGYALCALGRGDAEAAIAILQGRAMTATRGTESARGVLLAAYLIAGRQAEAERLQREILAGPDSPAKLVALALRENVPA